MADKSRVLATSFDRAPGTQSALLWEGSTFDGRHRAEKVLGRGGMGVAEGVPGNECPTIVVVTFDVAIAG